MRVQILERLQAEDNDIGGNSDSQYPQFVGTCANNFPVASSNL